MGTSEEGFRFVVQFKKDASVQQIKELLVEKYRLLLPQKIHEGRRYVLATTQSAAEDVMRRLQQESIVEQVEPVIEHHLS